VNRTPDQPAPAAATTTASTTDDSSDTRIVRPFPATSRTSARPRTAYPSRGPRIRPPRRRWRACSRSCPTPAPGGGRRRLRGALLLVVWLLCGANTQQALARWAQAAGQARLRQLGLTDARGPSLATLHRLLQQLAVADPEAALGRWVGRVRSAWSESVAGPEPEALLKAPAALRELFAHAGVTPDREVITYCGAAVWSAQSYFVLRLLGYPRVRLYDGSWQEWVQDPALPVETAA